MEDKTKVSIEIDNGFFEMKVEKKSETNAPTHVIGVADKVEGFVVNLISVQM